MATPVAASASATAGSRGAFSTRVGGWGTRRPTAVAAALYLLLSLIMFAPGIVPGRTLSASDLLWTATPWDSSQPADVPPLGSNRELADSVSEFQPALQATRAALPHIPLWDPDTLSGRPFIADPPAVPKEVRLVLAALVSVANTTQAVTQGQAIDSTRLGHMASLQAFRYAPGRSSAPAVEHP